MPKSFRELRVWQASMDLTFLIYELTAEFPKHEVYGLSSQMRRAPCRWPATWRRAQAAALRRDFRQFVIMARGSNFELQTQLLVAARLRYASEARLHQAETLALEVGRMLNGLSNYLKHKQETVAQPSNVERIT